MIDHYMKPLCDARLKSASIRANITKYYDETEDGNVGFEISEDGQIFLNRVSEIAKDLSRWLDNNTNIMDLIEELDNQ